MLRGELHLLCPLKLYDRFHEHAVAQLLPDLFAKLFQVYAFGLQVGKQRHQNVRIAVLPDFGREIRVRDEVSEV